MLGRPEDEAELLTQMKVFEADPIGFIIYSYPWGKAGTPLENFKGPRAWQREALEYVERHAKEQMFAFENGLPLKVCEMAFASGRGPGKTTLNSMLAHWHMSCHWGSTTIVSANNEAQLRINFFPELSKWVSIAVNSRWFCVEMLKVSIDPELASWMLEQKSIDSRYWYIQGRMWSEENPDGFRGPHNPLGMMLVFEEGSGIPTPIWDNASPFFSDPSPHRYFLTTSQMSRRSGRFYDLFHDKGTQETPGIGFGWFTRTISTIGLEGVDQARLQQEIARHGRDSDYVRVHIEGLAPRTAEDQFIPQGNIAAAQTNALVSDWGEPLILGVDPAPRGKSAWRFRQGRNARDCCGPATRGVWEGKDNVQIAQAVLDLDSKYHPDAICIDFGMGTGVIDILKRKYLRHKLHVVNFSESPHKADNLEWATHAIELWAKMRDWLPGGMIEQDSGDKGTLSFQLMNRGWRWSQKEDGKKILETKKDMKARGVDSPDDADALACTFEVNPPRRDDDRARGKPLMAQGVGSSMTDD
jgi:hypothetical protein